MSSREEDIDACEAIGPRAPDHDLRYRVWLSILLRPQEVVRRLVLGC